MTTDEATRLVNQALQNYDKKALLEAINALAASRGRTPQTITAKVTPTAFESLQEQAASQGLTVEEFVSDVLDRRAITHGYWI